MNRPAHWTAILARGDGDPASAARSRAYGDYRQHDPQVAAQAERVIEIRDGEMCAILPPLKK